MKVLHVAHSSEYGLGRYLADLVDVQRQAGWDVWVAGHPAADIRARVIASGAGWLHWRASRQPGPSTAAEVRALRAVARRVEPDLFHLHSSKAGLAGRLLLRGRRPTIFQPHAWSFFAVDGTRRSLALAWERFAGARWSNVLLCVSEDERRRGEAAGVRGPFAVVPTGVDTGLFHPAPKPPGSPPTAVCVGRLAVSQKGQDVLLAAWPAVVERVPDARLVLVGDGPDRAALEMIAPASVEFTGRVDDVVRRYHAADVVVQPSRYEGLSLTVLEALACGRPVVAADAEGMREVIGDAGAVVPVGDADALARALIERLEHPERAALEGEAARQRVEGSYSRSRWADRMLDLARDVVTQAPSR